MLTAALFVLASAGSPRTYVVAGADSFDPHQVFRSVGVFGAFGKGDQVQDRDFYGLLTFTLRCDASTTMVWPNYFGAKDLVLGKASFGSTGKPSFDVLDWTTARLRFTGTDVYFSRMFPAVLYRTQSHRFGWGQGDIPFDRAAYVGPGGKVGLARSGESLSTLGAPWVVIWNSKPTNGEIAPFLIRFEHRPSRLSLEGGLNAEFDQPAGGVVVMPLHGIRRVSGTDTAKWSGGLPAGLAQEATEWSARTAAFPIGCDETYRLDDVGETVSVTDAYRYSVLHDDWSTSPRYSAPVPPVTAVAAANGYPVHWISGSVIRSSTATFLGPYAYEPGKELRYTIPVPTSRDNEPTPLRIAQPGSGSELDKLTAGHEINPQDTSDGGLNLQLKEYSEAYRLLSDPVRQQVSGGMKAAFDSSYSDSNLQTVTDPVLGSSYVMCNKIWCAGEAYDREWYGGRQLDFTSEYVNWVDPTAAARHWKAIQGLYSYFRIYNDWAWSGTTSSLFAYALCGDGMNFAMEGMLATARLAKRVGDTDIWRDASYRAAKEEANTYASWFLTDWLKSVDYVTWTDTSYDYQAKKGRYVIRRMPPDQAQTGFGLDIFSDTTGIKVFRPGSIWHGTAAFYWNNPSLYRLYAERLYPKVYKWEFETMPKLYPGWDDRDKHNDFDNAMYGSNLTIVHLDARANLFGVPRQELIPLTAKLQPDIAFLYRMREQEDLIEAGAPQFWAPVADATVENAQWDPASQTLTASLVATSMGPAQLEWTWRGKGGVSSTPSPGPAPQKVLVNGKSTGYRLLLGGFYSVPIRLKTGDRVELQIVYR